MIVGDVKVEKIRIRNPPSIKRKTYFLDVESIYFE